MKDKAFIDTNILIYLYSADEQEKRNICLNAIRKYECLTSTQALNELSNVFSRKWRLNGEEIKKAIYEIQCFCKITLVDIDIINKALDIHSKYGFSYFDSLMLSSALTYQCKYILTEDMHDKQKIDGMEIRNVFSHHSL